MTQNQHEPTVTRIGRGSRDPIPLAAPDVPIAFHDLDTPGLLPVSALNAPITVDLLVWDGAEAGFTYQLLWDDNLVGDEKLISGSELVGDPLALEITPNLLAEGKHTVAYRTYNPFGQTTADSEVFSIEIDRTAPGKPELAAIQFPVEVQNGLTAAELVQLGDKLSAEIAGYTGMAKHDVVHTYWGNTAGPEAHVDQDDMGLNRVFFEFTKSFLESIEPGPQQVHYTITDRAGNISDFSLSVEITLLLEEIPTNYPAPRLEPAVGNLIDYAEARSGIKVDIPHYSNAAAFDQIVLYWGDNLALPPVQILPGSEDEEVVLSLQVDYDTIALNPKGIISLKYEVNRQGQLNGSSSATMVEIFITLPISPPEVPPTIQGTSIENANTDDNFIDEDDYELNARAILKWNSSFQISDEINIYWGSQQKLQWYQIQAEDITAASDLIIPITNSIMKAQGIGAEIPVHYSVARSGNPNPTNSPVQLVTVRSKENLPGGPNGLDGPPFNLNSAGYLSPALNEDGADIFIAPYMNISENQKLFLTFKGFDRNDNPIEAATYTDTRVLDDQDVSKGYTFTVPWLILRTVCRGFAEASLRVEPASGSNQSAVTSKTTKVPVEMRQPNEPVCLI